MTSYKVLNYCGTRYCRPETFHCKDLRFRPLSATEKLWSNLAGIQTVHSRLTSSQHIPTVLETPDSLLASWFQSCVAQSPAYCLDYSASWVAIIRCITSLLQSNLIGPPTFRRRERDRNRPFTRPICPCGEKWSGNETNFRSP